MKTIEKVIAVMIIGLLIMGSTSNAFGQESSYLQKNVIKVKPLSFELGYERALTNTISLQVSARVLPFRLSFDDDDTSFSYTNYRVMPEVRFYVAGRNGAPEGLFLAPFMKAGITEIKAETQSDTDLTARVKFKGSSLGGGFSVGWQWIANGGFSIDTQIGLGYNQLKFENLEVTYEDGTVEVEKAPINRVYSVLPRISFSIGYAF